MRLCWSDTGWLSMLKDVSACSPRGWNVPLESAATPGDVSVSNELSPLLTLSLGSVSSSDRSTCVDGVSATSLMVPRTDTCSCTCESDNMTSIAPGSV